jgi:hypothetical protein
MGAPVEVRSVAANSVENDDYRVVVDSASGAISSLYDKRNARELVDGAAGVGFNDLIRADQENAFVWGAWTGVAAGVVQVTSTNGPLFRQLRITRSASPVSETIVTLTTGLPRVDIHNRLEHDRTEHADEATYSWWYYAPMPFALGTGFTGRFEAPNGWLVPQQDWMPGTRHGTRVVRHASDIRAADGYGVTVANRESYLQAFGSLSWWDAGEPDAPILFHNLFARQDGTDTADQGWVDFATWEPGAPRTYDSHFAITGDGRRFRRRRGRALRCGIRAADAGGDDPPRTTGLTHRTGAVIDRNLGAERRARHDEAGGVRESGQKRSHPAPAGDRGAAGGGCRDYAAVRDHVR